MSNELTLPTTTGGFHAETTVEVEQNSKGINKRIRVNIAWENWTASYAKDERGDVITPDTPLDFMVGLGDGRGGSGKNVTARMVLARLVLEGMVSADMAIAAGLTDSPHIIEADFRELVKAAGLTPGE